MRSWIIATGRTPRRGQAAAARAGAPGRSVLTLMNRAPGCSRISKGRASAARTAPAYPRASPSAPAAILPRLSASRPIVSGAFQRRPSAKPTPPAAWTLRRPTAASSGRRSHRNGAAAGQRDSPCATRLASRVCIALGPQPAGVGELYDTVDPGRGTAARRAGTAGRRRSSSTGMFSAARRSVWEGPPSSSSRASREVTHSAARFKPAPALAGRGGTNKARSGLLPHLDFRSALGL